MLISAAVYLECHSTDQNNARKGAAQVLKWVAQTWLNDPNLVMEDKYTDL